MAGRAGSLRRGLSGVGGRAGGCWAAVGAPSPLPPRSAAGQLCLRRRAMRCVSISPCPRPSPPGATAALNPLRAAIGAPGRARGGASAASARIVLGGDQGAPPNPPGRTSRARPQNEDGVQGSLAALRARCATEARGPSEAPRAGARPAPAGPSRAGAEPRGTHRR